MKISLRQSLTLFSTLGTLAFSACDTTGRSAAFDSSSEGTLVATSRAALGGKTKPSVEDGGEAEGIARRHGRLFYVKNHGATLIGGRQRVTEGLYLERNGDVTIADGRRFRVLEGYLVTRAGDVVEAPGFLR